MEQENLNQEKRIEPKIRVSRDGKWVIERISRSEIELFLQDHPDSDVVIIKPVAYFEKILARAKERTGSGLATSAEKIK